MDGSLGNGQLQVAIPYNHPPRLRTPNILRGDNITSGWSALNGQTQLAYIKGGVKHREMRLGHTVRAGVFLRVPREPC